MITRQANRNSIEAELALRPLPDVTFHYMDLPGWILRFKRGTVGVYAYYFFWQLGAYRYFAGRRGAGISFDVVHHVTFASMRMPSFMALLGRPVIFGPVGGGESSPVTLWWPLGWHARVREMLRNLSLWWLQISPLMRFTFGRASRIFVTSPQSQSLLSPGARIKSRTMLAIALDNEACEVPQRPMSRPADAPFRIVFAGRLLYWKGLEYGLQAFARFASSHPHAELTIIGQGPEQSRLKDVVAGLNANSLVRWVPTMGRDEFLDQLPRFDVLLFPSFHDSGAMVVLEAMSARLPVVCLDVGGPGQLVSEECGFRIAPTRPEEVVDGMVRSLRRLADDPSLRQAMGERGRERALQYFSWSSKAAEMRRSYDEVVRDGRPVDADVRKRSAGPDP